MQGWHGDKGRHSKAAKLGWLRRIGQRRAARRLNRKIERDIKEFQALTSLEVTLNKIKNQLEVTDVDKRRRIGVLFKPYKDRTVTHRIEMKWNPKTQEWEGEPFEVGTVVARRLGHKTLYFIEQESRK